MDILQLRPAKHRGGKRYSLTSPRIDMTPMVDLGFLLITFFIFTTSMSQPTSMKLFMPTDKILDITPSKLEEKFALTVILDSDNRIYYYHGTFEDARISNQIFQTNYDQKNGIGKIIRMKQKNVAQYTDGIQKMMILIKPTPRSTYQNTVDVLDEMLINNVRKYAIVDLEKEELVYINR